MNTTRLAAAAALAGLGLLAAAPLASADPVPQVLVCHVPPGNEGNPQLLTVGSPSTQLEGHTNHPGDLIEGRDGDATAVETGCTTTPSPTTTTTEPTPSTTTTTTEPTPSTTTTTSSPTTTGPTWTGTATVKPYPSTSPRPTTWTGTATVKPYPNTTTTRAPRWTGRPVVKPHSHTTSAPAATAPAPHRTASPAAASVPTLAYTGTQTTMLATMGTLLLLAGVVLLTARGRLNRGAHR